MIIVHIIHGEHQWLQLWFELSDHRLLAAEPDVLTDLMAPNVSYSWSEDGLTCHHYITHQHTEETEPNQSDDPWNPANLRKCAILVNPEWCDVQFSALGHFYTESIEEEERLCRVCVEGRHTIIFCSSDASVPFLLPSSWPHHNFYWPGTKAAASHTHTQPPFLAAV